MILFGFGNYLSERFGHDKLTSFDIARIPKGFLFFFFSYIIFLYAILYYHHNSVKVRKKRSKGKTFFLLLIPYFLIGILYLLIYYPGVGMTDSVVVVMSKNYWIARQHPWLYSLAIQKLTAVMLSLGYNYENVFFVEGIINIIITSLVYAYCATWLGQKNIDDIPFFLFVSFFAFDPMLNLYRVTLLKDIPFSYILTLWVTILWDAYESGGKTLKKPFVFFQIIFIMFVSFIRGNGIYITIFILTALLLTYKQQYKTVLSLFAILLIMVVGNSAFERAHGIKHLFKETVGIPLQQIAAAVSKNGVITEAQLDFIDKVIPVEFIKEKYDPYCADPLKWRGSPIDNDFLYEHKIDFLKVWLQMLIPNFRIYVKAYLQITYGFWSTIRYLNEHFQYSTIYVPAYNDFFETNNIQIQNFFPEKIQKFLKNLTFDAARSALSEGQLFWLFVLLTMVLIRVKGKGALIICVPGFANWLSVMVATPVSHSYRYTLCLPIMIPLILAIILVKNDSNETFSDNNKKLSV